MGREILICAARLLQAPVPRLNRAIAEEQLGMEAAARGDAAAAERLYSAAVEVRGAERAAPERDIPAALLTRSGSCEQNRA